MSKYFKAEDVINLLATEYYTHALANSLVKVEDYKVVAERNTKHLPTVEVSEDCISREWLLNGLSKMADDWVINNAVQHGVYEAHDFVKTAPSVVPKPKEGEWEIAHEKYEYIRACSECGWLHDLVHYGDSFCPHCGAKMKGADDES